jgi:hypothetical protein
MIFIIYRDFCNMNFIYILNVIEEMDDALNIIGQKYDIKDMILFAIILLVYNTYTLDFNHIYTY